MSERMKFMTKSKYEAWEWVKALAIAVALAFLIRTFLFTPVIVEGASMAPTLLDNDRMIVTKIGDLNRFDVVVFHATEEADYIKRIIGLPGDRVEYKNDVLYINGTVYEEPYLDEYKNELKQGPYTYDFSTTVPKDSLFVMGDNRRNSKDSRDIGAIPMEKVIGTTSIIYWPIQEIKILGNQ